MASPSGAERRRRDPVALTATLPPFAVGTACAYCPPTTSTMRPQSTSTSTVRSPPHATNPAEVVGLNQYPSGQRDGGLGDVVAQLPGVLDGDGDAATHL
jgi:hypothetical protein